MRWRLSEIPETIQDVQQAVRSRALGIAEQLVGQGRDRVEALREALERAQRMGNAESAIGRVPPEREFFVVRTDGEWRLRGGGETEEERSFSAKNEAVEKGIQKAENFKGNLYVHAEDGRLEEVHSFVEPESVSEATEGVRVRLESLEDLYVEQLQDLYSGEEQLIAALERLSQKAYNNDLKQVFEEHLEETRGQKEKLEHVFGRLGKRPGKETCQAMAGIISESEEIIQACADPDTCDAGLIAAAQRAEHYEIAGYGSAVVYAERLGHSEDLDVLKSILSEEKKADKSLTKVAENVINPKAQKKK